MRNQFLYEELEKNLPFQLATAQYLSSQKGKTQNVFMPYATKLRTFAGWFAQLLAESTGKIDVNGKNVGLTPIAALGVTDQHSQMQLYAEGPNDKLVLFVTVEQFKQDPVIPAGLLFSGVGVSFGKLLVTDHKATADDEFGGGSFEKRLDQGRNALRGMGQVGIHADEHLSAGLVQAENYGRRQSPFVPTYLNADRQAPLCQRRDHFDRAVFAVVVHDDDLAVSAGRLHSFGNARHELSQVLGFMIGGDDD